MLRWSRFASVALACALLGAHARAQAEAPDAVAIVVESGGGLPSADQLRSQLVHQFGARIVSLGTAATHFDPPGALLTIAVDSSRVVNALYWDRTGNADILSVPLPASSGTAPALRGGASSGGTAPALRGGASSGGTAPALRGGASSGGSLEVIATTLASALLTRCLPALDAAPHVSRFDFERQVWQRAMSNPPVAWRAIYAAAGRMGLVTPRGTSLSIEDF